MWGGNVRDRRIFPHVLRVSIGRTDMSFLHVLHEVSLIQKTRNSSFGKGLELVGRLHQPPKHGVGVDLEHPRRTPDAVWSKNSCGFTGVVFQEPPESFTTLNWRCTLRVLADCRKEQHIALALVIPLMMKMRHIRR